MLGTIGAVVNPDVHADTERDLALEAGNEARPTQLPQPLRIVDVRSGYPEDLETFAMPDTVNVEDILSVDVTPLTSISISGMDVTSCPDMSVAVSKSIDLGTYRLCLLILMIELEKFSMTLNEFEGHFCSQKPL